MLVVAIIGVLAAIAVPVYRGYVEKQRRRNAIAQIQTLQAAVDRYRTEFGAYPVQLSHAHPKTLVDPWGDPYVYLRLDPCATPCKPRKDKNLVPLNTDFDLYSKGADGDSMAPLTAQASHDDIVRANDGSFVGLASDY